MEPTVANVRASPTTPAESRIVCISIYNTLIYMRLLWPNVLGAPLELGVYSLDDFAAADISLHVSWRVLHTY